MPSLDENAKELCRREEKLFNAKSNLDALNQELAYNFYPERADFTTERALGVEFATDLFDGEPLRCRRGLGDIRASMLRPRGQEWFRAKLGDDELNERPDIARFLQAVNDRARSRIYEARSGFVKAEKQADHDVVTFGGSIKSFEAARTRDGTPRLLAKCWHPRDCAYLDDADGIGQDFMARRFKASARHIRRKFPDAELAKPITDALDKDPDKEFRLCHVMMRADEYDYYQKPNKKEEWASVYYDSAHKKLLRERPSARFRYVVDKWGELTGTQYPYSPSAMAGVADARGMQVMMRVLLEAGEKSLDPPLKAVQRAVKGQINAYAAGVTWVDKDYDERMGPAIEPLLPPDIKPAIGIDLITRATVAMRDNWYLNQLRLPQQAKTAYETAQLVEEFVRANIPLFEPWETGLERDLDEIFAVLIDIGEFGPLSAWPDVFSGGQLEFAFANPLQDAIERNKVNQYQITLGLMAGAVQLDPNVRHAVDLVKGLQDGVRGTGAPADWLPDDDTVNQAVAASQQAGNVVAGMQAAGQAADIANTGLDAAAKLRDLNAAAAADGTGAFGPS